MSTDRVVYQGDTHTEKATLTDDAGVPIDDPSAIYRLTVKRSPFDDDTTIVGGTTAGQTTPGVAYLALAPDALINVAAPAVLVWDAEVKEGDGRTTTLASGKLTVLPSIYQGP